MKRPGFWLIFLLLLIAQLLLSTYANFSPYVVISLLPVMILCIPIRVSTYITLLVAFVSGLAVDFLSEGLLGLNALALVPVALARVSIIRLIFGEELLARKEDFSVKRSGLGKVIVAILLSVAVFMAVYVWVDAAGTRPLLFNFLRFAASLAVSSVLSILVIDLLAPDSRK